MAAWTASPAGSAEIDRRLGYHPATRETIPLYEANRAAAVAFACHLDSTCPPGRELALALTAVQEALMWANAAVACNLAPLEDPAGRQPNPLVEQMAERARLSAGDPTDVAPGDVIPPAVQQATPALSSDQGGCASCGRPFHPDHDADGPGPTVRHPFQPGWTQLEDPAARRNRG